MESTLFTVTQAAQYLRVSKSFLDNRRVTGDGPVFAKLGRKVVYDKADLLSWLAARRATSTSQQVAA